MNLESLWREIGEEQSLTRVPGMTVRRVDPVCPDDIFVGIRQPAGAKLLMLRLPSKPGLSRTSLVQSRGFITHLSRFEHDPQGSYSLVLEATDPVFNSVFTVLAGDLVERIKKRGPGDTSVSAFFGCLQHWKRFFDVSGREGLSDELLLGLFAELTFLHDYAIRYISDAAAAISGWVGPDPLCKDFQYPGCAVEVKGTASAEPLRVRISSERQLDDDCIANLILFVLITERAAGNGATVPELVERIRTALGETAERLIFEEKLLALGYHDVHRDKYESRRFIVHGHRIFHVRQGFPRLTSDLPQGVGDVSYAVILSTCAPFAIIEKKLTELLSLVPSHDA